MAAVHGAGSEPRWLGWSVSVLGLLGGVAIVADVYVDASVWLTFIAVGGPCFAFFLVGWMAASAHQRALVREAVGVGLLVGVAGLIAYDTTRWLLVGMARSEINPFEALPVFGQLLVGSARPEWMHWVAGFGYHVANGLGFAVFYVLFFGRRGALAGLCWALVLEFAMLAVYPGWLDIRARSEFTVVSSSGHVAYGLTIGHLAKQRLESLYGR